MVTLIQDHPEDVYFATTRFISHKIFIFITPDNDVVHNIFLIFCYTSCMNISDIENNMPWSAVHDQSDSCCIQPGA